MVSDRFLASEEIDDVDRDRWGKNKMIDVVEKKELDGDGGGGDDDDSNNDELTWTWAWRAFRIKVNAVADLGGRRVHVMMRLKGI